MWKINDTFAGGVPDFFLAGRARDLWLEVKYTALPKRTETLIDLTRSDRYLSTLQQHWLTQRHALRGDVAVLLASPEGGVVWYGLDWQRPISTLAFRAAMLPRPALVAALVSTLNNPG